MAKHKPSSQEDIQKVLAGGIPLGRWREGLLFESINPTPGLNSAANWLPRSEEVGPDEMRITFMGTAPLIRPGQMNTSIWIELGSGDNFVFDLGEGSVANYVAAGVAINQLDKIFITHLHIDHFGALPWLYMFGGWAGRWHKPLRVFGASGRSPQFGTKHMVQGMKQMLTWHRDAFSVFPVGQGHDVDVTEFDFRDNGGVVYDENGAKVIHWQRSHAKDGASAYRLDWNGLSVVWTGDGRPSLLDAEYAAGADVYITETQTELFAIGASVQGVPPFLARYTVDTHHTPGYAAGYVAKRANPRLFMTTHCPHDPYMNAETVAQIREHWKGPYHPGTPDGVVVNVTKDDIWVREGILPAYPNARAPQQDFDDGQLVVPHPPKKREEIQEPFIRDQEVPPEDYYPKGYAPELLFDWPVDGDLVAPVEVMPPQLVESMGAAWRQRQAYRRHIDEIKAAAS